ncbi:hypothetical protein [Patulibacter defluvii]|uniref:hypothetical protein n=1 Tax=Patulibacter defluvii TaxID=3095358 RepID=UPI002A74920B|nr:hypothetical protein [Patulibacter sp. DM4]
MGPATTPPPEPPLSRQTASLEAVILRGLPVILGATLIGVLAALLFSLTTPQTFEAEARVQARLEAQDSSILSAGNSGAGVAQTVDQVAYTAMNTLERQDVVQEATKRLAEAGVTGEDTLKLAQGLDTEITPGTGIIFLRAKDHDAKKAAKIADSFALALRTTQINGQRQVYSKAAERLRKEYRQRRRSGADGADVGNLTRESYAATISRLDSLAQIAQPIQLLQRANVPTSAIAPKPVRNSLIGAAVGLLIGLLIVTLRATLDRRLRSVDQLRGAGAPLVGTIPDKLGNAVDKKTGRLSLGAGQLEPFRVLRRNLRFLTADEEPKVVLVTSAQPSAGKSVTAAGLAAAYASSGRSTLLVECDLRRPVQASRLQVQGAPGLGEYLRGVAEPADVVRRVPLSAILDGSDDTAEVGTDVVLVPAGEPTGAAAELVDSRRFEDFLNEVRDVYDVIVVDSTPLLQVADAGLLVPKVDTVLVCAWLGATSHETLKTALETVERNGGTATGVVATAVSRRQDPAHEAYGYTYYGAYGAA